MGIPHHCRASSCQNVLVFFVVVSACCQGFLLSSKRPLAMLHHFHSALSPSPSTPSSSSSSSSANTSNENNNNIEWEIYVDQSRASLEKGASTTLDALFCLAPNNVKIIPAILFPKPPKSKLPLLRCVSLLKKDLFRGSGGLEVTNVDSVDKVYRVLTKHMKLNAAGGSVKWTACECLKWKYKGNGHLEANEISLAIEAYNKALACDWPDQHGPVLLMRASAYLQRAAAHKVLLTAQVQDLPSTVPEFESLKLLYQQALTHPTLTPTLLQKVVTDTQIREGVFSKTKYRHGLYQYALLHAAQDALRATQLLPQHSMSWLCAGEILGELWKLGESVHYYELALLLDPELKSTVIPIIQALQKRQELLDAVRVYGWSEDMLRFALDVAA